MPRRSGAISNERLEFLGDAVLGWAIADIVYHRYPVAEGQLTDLRKSVVNAIALAEVAQASASAITCCSAAAKRRPEAPASRRSCPTRSKRYSAPCTSTVGRMRPTRWSSGWWCRACPTRRDAIGQFDQKTELQELCARLGRGAPVYEVSSHGPDHAKTFHARVLVDGDVIGVGTGRSKKAAEQLAATERCLSLG